jgi:hypothetical protein
LFLLPLKITALSLSAVWNQHIPKALAEAPADFKEVLKASIVCELTTNGVFVRWKVNGFL